MKYIIPAKGTSTRVRNKNWRTFHDGLSLVDITIEKLIEAEVDPKDIYVSCEDDFLTSAAHSRWGVNELVRSEDLCSNSVPLTTWIRAITNQADPEGTEDIAWCQVCDPLFNDYKECFRVWKRSRSNFDSLVVCYPWKGYLMTDNCQPVGWSFGEHHTPSQHLPQFRMMPFTLSILSPGSIKETGYHVGRKPYWFKSHCQHVDIDTEQDFEMAQYLYGRQSL